jgi:outer membrane protein OmpA-like peptidoglycan-associated protein
VSSKTSQLVRLFALVAGAAIATAAPAAAQVPGGTGFFGAVDGRWMWLGGDRVENGLGGPTRSSSGPGGQVLVGYKFDSRWDVALAGGVQQLLTDITQFRNGRLSLDMNNQHVDLEVGYSTGNWRYSAGLRGIRHLHGVAYNAPGLVGYDQREIWGLGVKAGVGTRQALDDNFALVGGIDGALVYGQFWDSGTGGLLRGGIYYQLVPQLGGELGVNWRSSDEPNFSVTVGGRIDASFNTMITTNDGVGRGTRLAFGPFIRLAYNFAGPHMRQPIVPQPEAPPATAAKRDYLVFFDFDRSTITTVAQGTIRQAANDAKVGRVARLQVTGHADRAGADAYNMALSQRRAEAVRAELVRNGVPAEQIVVLARGESEPLVPTADGVREPQNRRVVISF